MSPTRLRLALALFAAAPFLGGCASIDWDFPRARSAAFEDTQDTSIGQAVAGLGAPGPGESGFLLLSDGIDALAMRLLLAKEAERSIDAQYYL